MIKHQYSGESRINLASPDIRQTHVYGKFYNISKPSLHSDTRNNKISVNVMLNQAHLTQVMRIIIIVNLNIIHTDHIERTFNV